jgi:glycolate oxidase FAD binding subunit
MAMTAAPAATSAAIREQVLEARARGGPMRIVGRGAWLDAGAPVRAERTLDLTAHSGIVEYVPGDVTLTALAGTTLDEIARVTGSERQWLALDPFGSSDGTLGATVATAASGPLAHAFGTPRDQVLGMEVVSGGGDVIRAGGRVVKNVAGFDLTRLFTGSWGTLGAITEVTVRLRAMPAAEAHLTVAVPDDRPAAVATLCRQARELRAEPYALELVSPALAGRLGLPSATTLLVRLGGNAAAVTAQRDALASVGRFTDIPAATWAQLRGVEPAGSAVVRLGGLPSEFAPAWQSMREAVAAIPGALVHGSPGRGTVRAILPDAPQSLLEDVLRDLARHSRPFIAERLPPALWPVADKLIARRPVSDETTASHRVRAALMRRVKDTYDPMHLLNPGILGEAIA